MLNNNAVSATIAVKDMSRARKFYEGTLGLKPIETVEDDVITYEAGDSRLFVYKSKFAGGYGATVATWTVGDEIDDIVKTLHDKGVAFEHYKDMSDMKIAGDMHVFGDMKVAWFKDPDGNIISLVN